MDKKPQAKNLELITVQKLTSNYPGLNLKTNKTLTLKDCRRLLSALIKRFIALEVDSSFSKDLAYLLTTYVNLVRSVELETRLDKLEKQIRGGR